MAKVSLSHIELVWQLTYQPPLGKAIFYR